MANLTMAQLFIGYYAEWSKDFSTNLDLPDYLYRRDVVGEKPGQIRYDAHWDLMSRHPTARFDIVEFGDGSYALRPKHAEANHWRAC